MSTCTVFRTHDHGKPRVLKVAAVERHGQVKLLPCPVSSEEVAKEVLAELTKLIAELDALSATDKARTENRFKKERFFTSYCINAFAASSNLITEAAVPTVAQPKVVSSIDGVWARVGGYLRESVAKTNSRLAQEVD